MSALAKDTVTFKHQIAGSVIHYQKKKAHKDADAEPVKTLLFAGKRGGLGYYSTDDAGEIEALTALAKNPQVQLERVEGSIDVALEAPVEVISKPIDPAITQATSDVQNDAARNADPKVIAAQDGLAQLLRQQAGN